MSNDSKRFLQDVFSLRDGKAILTIEYLEPMSAEELADLEEWLALILRRVKRSAGKLPAAEPVRPSQAIQSPMPPKRPLCGSRYDHDALRLRAARYIAEYGPATAYRLHQRDLDFGVEDVPTQPTWTVALKGHPWFTQEPDGWHLTAEGLAAVKGTELPAPTA